MRVAVCECVGIAARTDLCGGRGAISVPTATIAPTFVRLAMSAQVPIAPTQAAPSIVMEIRPCGEMVRPPGLFT